MDVAKKTQLRQDRVQRQTQAIRDAQVISYDNNEPFRYKSTVRRSMGGNDSASLATAPVNDASPYATPLTERTMLFNGSIALFEYHGPQKLNPVSNAHHLVPASCKTTSSPPNTVYPNEVYLTEQGLAVVYDPATGSHWVIVYEPLQKKQLLKVEIDALYSVSLVPQSVATMPSILIPGTLRNVSGPQASNSLVLLTDANGNANAVYFKETNALESFLQSIALVKYAATSVAGHVNTDQVLQDTEAGIHTNSFVNTGDLVKIKYTLYKVNTTGVPFVLGDVVYSHSIKYKVGEATDYGVPSQIDDIIVTMKRKSSRIGIGYTRYVHGETNPLDIGTEWGAGAPLNDTVALEVHQLLHKTKEYSSIMSKQDVLPEPIPIISSNRKSLSNTEEKKTKTVQPVATPEVPSGKESKGAESQIFPVRNRRRSAFVDLEKEKDTVMADTSNSNVEDLLKSMEEPNVVESDEYMFGYPDKKDQEEDCEEEQQEEDEDEEEEQVVVVPQKQPKQQKVEVKAEEPSKGSLSERMKRLAIGGAMGMGAALPPTLSNTANQLPPGLMTPVAEVAKSEPAYIPSMDLFSEDPKEEEEVVAPTAKVMSNTKVNNNANNSQTSPKVQNSMYSLLEELNLTSYYSIFEQEALVSKDDLYLLEAEDLKALPLPVIVYRKLMKYLNDNNTTATTVVVDTGLVDEQKEQIYALKQEINSLKRTQASTHQDSYAEGRNDALISYKEKIDSMKSVANTKFHEKQEEIDVLSGQIARLTVDLDNANKEIGKNKELIREYVGKARDSRDASLRDIAELQGTIAQLHKDLQTAQRGHVQELEQSTLDAKKAASTAVKQSLDSAFVALTDAFDANDVMDGEQVLRKLKEVLKKVAMAQL